MYFNKDMTLKDYVEILKRLNSVEVFEEYKEFLKLLDLINTLFKRYNLLLINTSKEIKDFYEEDESLTHLNSFIYRVTHKVYSKFDNIYSQLNLDFNKLVKRAQNSYPFNKLLISTSKVDIISSIKDCYDDYFSKEGIYKKLMKDLFKGKTICLSCFKKLGLDYPLEESALIKMYVENNVKKQTNEGFLLDLFLLCSGC